MLTRCNMNREMGKNGCNVTKHKFKICMSIDGEGPIAESSGGRRQA